MSADAGAQARDGRGRGRNAVLALAGGAVALGVLLLVGGVIGYRLGLFDIGVARDGARAAAMVAFAVGGVLAVLGGIWSGLARSSKGVILAIGAFIGGGTGGGWLYGQRILTDALPPIWDIQTDWSQPVMFTEQAMAQRAGDGAPELGDGLRVGEGQGAWSGMSFGDAQKTAFDLAPLVVNVPPGEAILAAEVTARRLGWTVVMVDPPGGRLEAVSTSRWYGLRTDIAVRALPAGAGARIDVRATGRTAGGDTGALARRVQAVINDTAFALRGR